MLRHSGIFVIGVFLLAVPSFTIMTSQTSFHAFLASANQFDGQAETSTLPLYQGMHNGTMVWYIVTESSDRDDAEARGVNWTPRLTSALNRMASTR